jgi:hypothetical protein
LTEHGFPPIEACNIGSKDYKDVYLNVIEQAKNYKKYNDYKNNTNNYWCYFYIILSLNL